MKYLFLLGLAIISSNFLSAQNSFEGSFAVGYKGEKGETRKAEVKVRGNLIYIKILQGGLARYQYFILDLATREFQAISRPDKKTVMKFDIDKLTESYEKEQLKAGYKRNSDLDFRTTEKTKDENGIRMIKYTGEDEIHKSFFWLAKGEFNFNQLIPVLRLIGCWNEAQAKEGIIYHAEVTNKVSKRESSVSVMVKKEFISKENFIVPKNYLIKDFGKLMEENKNNKDLKTIIQTFAGF